MSTNIVDLKRIKALEDRMDRLEASLASAQAEIEKLPAEQREQLAKRFPAELKGMGYKSPQTGRVAQE